MNPSIIFLSALSMVTVSIVAVNGINIVAEQKIISPVEVLSGSAVTSTVPRGGEIQYRLTVAKMRDCPAEYDIMFISDAGDLKTAGTLTGGKWHVGGPETLTLTQELPESVNPGRWNLKIVGRARCEGEHWTWHIKHPLIPFEVTE